MTRDEKGLQMDGFALEYTTRGTLKLDKGSAPSDTREREELTMRVTASVEVSDLTTVGACNRFAGHEDGRNLRGQTKDTARGHKTKDDNRKPDQTKQLEAAKRKRGHDKSEGKAKDTLRRERISLGGLEGCGGLTKRKSEGVGIIQL
jgi:hypothetical protein